MTPEIIAGNIVTSVHSFVQKHGKSPQQIHVHPNTFRIVKPKLLLRFGSNYYFQAVLGGTARSIRVRSSFSVNDSQILLTDMPPTS